MRKTLVKRLIALAFVLLFGLSALAEPATIRSSTRVYKTPSTSAQSIKVKKGTSVEVLAVNGSWALIEKNGIQAYIKKKYLKAAPQPTATPEPTAAPTAAPEPEAVAQVTVLKNTKAYKKPSTSSQSVNVKKGLTVELLAVSGSWAMVRRSGIVAYMKRDVLSAAASATPAPTATPAAEDLEALRKNARAAVAVTSTRVYARPDTSSVSAKVSPGLEVNWLKTEDGWALVERSGVYGYMRIDALALKSEVSPSPSPTPAPTRTPAADAIAQYMSSSAYTNEQKCYYYLTRALGFNTAAACGIMANIRRESEFNPKCGSTYYGLVQWDGKALANMRAWCQANGYASDGISGQLSYLKLELQRDYAKVYNALMSAPNTAQGAYDAAYTFCYDFEIPASRASAAASRGVLARDTYFPKYTG